MSEPGARVTVIGSANLDLVVETPRLPAVGETLLGRAGSSHPGGKGLNQALAAARLGADTRLCAVVGDDAAGTRLQEALAEAGVGGQLRRTSSAPTGVAHIFALPESENSIVVAPGANAQLSPQDVLAEAAGSQVVLAQLEVPPAAVAAGLSAARESSATTILNAAPAHPDSPALFGLVDLLVVNAGECVEFGGIDALLAAGARTVILTRGRDGAEVHRAGHRPVLVPAFPVAAVDSTGAGDAFCGALAVFVAHGEPVETAVRAAAAAGAIVAGQKGANSPLLTLEAVVDLVTV